MYNNLLLPDGKYLGDVISFLPANKIIYKYLTGCGATHLELKCNRWSILIEPYIPVILGKKLMEVTDADGNKILVDNPNVLAVHGDISKLKIERYLTTKRKKYKIVSTPEGLKKIIEVCRELGVNVYKKFFLLVDECEKLIQDVDYREGIVEVMQEFFNFENRSFISATPIAPTDPRFEANGFEDFNIWPETKTKLNIDIYTTNNIASTIKDYFNINQAEHYIIFINSTDRIASIINFLNIGDDSQVFCAKESVDKLKANDIVNAHQYWDLAKFKKYNFFTSRFFTAFDLKVSCKPNVLIVSDVVIVKHSALDPNTDIIQIAGRARNGINHLAHISNWDVSLKSESETEVRAYIRGLQDGYNGIKQLRDQCSNNQNTGTYFVLNEALEHSTFDKYINKTTDEICSFMVDNKVHTNRVNGFYKLAQNLIDAYEATDRFIVNPIPKRYNIEDKDLDKLDKGLSGAKTMEYICELFTIHFKEESENPFTLNVNHALHNLIRTHQQLYRY